VSGQEICDSRKSDNEVFSKLRVGCLARHDQQADLVTHDSSQFVRLVADPGIVCDRRPVLSSDALEPFFIRRVWREVVGVSLHRQAGRSKHVWKLFAEIPIGEERPAQAACSYRTACSTSDSLRS